MNHIPHHPLEAPIAAPKPPGALALIGLIVLIVACGTSIGMLFPPGDWYVRLLKPTWNPPSWLFGPVWTFLYASMGFALWLVLREPALRHPLRERAIWLFIAQMFLNLAWSPIFFGMRSPGWAFAVICAMWMALVATAFSFGRIRPLAGYALGPYVLWLSFALVLNGTIWLMNS